ncbi:MAG: sigma-70 family RNA polymerase sigma factor [Alphaproteobacteria bacterium]|nr:sigma-70 family RNA polymerase sigma factor [Alphaproteobacteria bacterium]
MSPYPSKAGSSQGDSWSLLAAQAQNGDKTAYRRLLKEIAPFIRNSLFRGLVNPDWAEEIAQEVLISVHKSLNTYSPDQPFLPWLMAIVRFRRADFLRTHYRQRGEEGQASLEDPEFIRSHVTDSPLAGEYKDIEKALADLPVSQRRVLELMKIRGHSAREVADRLGMSVSAVKVSAHRSMIRLKKRLKY